MTRIASILAEGNPAAPRKAGVGQGWLLMLTNLLPVMAVVSLGPDIPQLFKHFHGVAHIGILIPMVMTAPALLVALLSPVAGALVDYMGRRRILLFAILLFAVIGVVPLFLDNLNVIVAFRVLLGLPNAIVVTVANTLVGDYYNEVDRRKWLAFQSGVGSILGTGLWLAGGFLADIGWRWPFAIYFLAIPIFVAGLYYLFEPKVAASTEADSKQAIEVGSKFPIGFMAFACAVTLFATTVYYVYTLYAGLAFDALGVKSPSMIGIATAAASIGVPVGAYIYNRIAAARTAYLLAFTFLVFGVGLIGLGFAPNYKVGIAVAFVLQLGSGTTIPILIVWVQSKLQFEQRGRGMGIWATCFFLGQFTCPVFLSIIGAYTSGVLQTMFVVGIISTIAAAVSMLSGVFQVRSTRAGATR